MVDPINVVLYDIISKRVRSMSMKPMSEVKADLGYSCAGFGRPRGSFSPTAMRAYANVRLPDSIDSQIRELAKRDATSIGHVIRAALEKGIPLLI
jgi:hypothetical protein